MHSNGISETMYAKYTKKKEDQIVHGLCHEMDRL